ncbi:LOW QUALITY PROTEIN: interferon alpha-10-like [Ctenodactylus gundi]
MALPFASLVALVVLMYRSSCSLGCDLPPTHRLGTQRALALLGQMRRISPFSCLKDRRDFAFPRQELDGSQVQKAQATAVLHETTRHTEDASAAWEQSLLDTLCAGLLQQLSHLEACVTPGGGLEEPPLTDEESRLAVRKHFRGIALYLREKTHSPCAWEVVRAEIMRSFSFSVTLQPRLRSQE